MYKTTVRKYCILTAIFCTIHMLREAQEKKYSPNFSYSDKEAMSLSGQCKPKQNFLERHFSSE